jgi:hypothetical protein
MIRLRKTKISIGEKSIEDSRCAGVLVKTDIHSGAWRCTACQGQAVGSDLIKPKCDYCELA